MTARPTGKAAARRVAKRGARPRSRARPPATAAPPVSAAPAPPAGPAAPTGAVFQVSMMAKVEAAAVRDPTIAAVLAAARSDPGALVARARREPHFVETLAAFFVAEMERDPAIAMEFARIAAAAAAAARPARIAAANAGADVDALALVSSESDNSDQSAEASSSDEKSR